jgi:hypothetical protein
VIEAGILQQIALIPAAQNCAHGKYDERRTAPRTREYERERKNKAERKHCDKALDKSLEDKFPASDPVAVLQSLTAAPTVSPQRTLS